VADGLGTRWNWGSQAPCCHSLCGRSRPERAPGGKYEASRAPSASEMEPRFVGKAWCLLSSAATPRTESGSSVRMPETLRNSAKPDVNFAGEDAGRALALNTHRR